MKPQQDLGEEAALLHAEPAHDAEIDRDEAAVRRRRTDCPDACRRGRSRRAAHGAGSSGSPCGRARAGRARGCSSARVVGQRDAVDPFDRQHVVRGAVPIDRRARGNPDRRGCSPPSPRARPPPAADPSPSRPSAPASRRPRSAAAAALPPNALRLCATKKKSARSRRKRRGDAGPQHLDRHRLRTPSALGLGAMHLRDRGRGDRRAEARERLRHAAFQRSRDRRLRLRSAGTAASGPAGVPDRAPCATPTTSGRVARNWPSFTIGRAEPGQRRDSRGPDSAPRRSISRASAAPAAPGGGSSAGSTTPSTPSRASTKPARASRARWAIAEITNASRNAARRCRRHASGRDAAKPASRIISAKAVGRGKLADRFDEIAIGFRVAGHHAAERRDHVERIDVVDACRAPARRRWRTPGTGSARRASARDRPRAARRRCAARCGCRRRSCRRRSC